MEATPKSSRISDKLCECGCGRPVMLRYGKPNRYIVGHGKSRLGTGASQDVTCIHCAVVTRVSGPSRIAGRRFCSTACRDGYRAAHTGAEHPSYNRTQIECPTCGTAHDVCPGRIKKGNVYCSAKCGRIGRALKITGMFAAKPGTLIYGRRAALRRDGFACVLCSFDVSLHVHHIVPRSKAGSHDPSNLATLCPNHHTLAHAKKLSATAIRAAVARRSLARVVTPQLVLTPTE